MTTETDAVRCAARALLAAALAAAAKRLPPPPLELIFSVSMT